MRRSTVSKPDHSSYFLFLYRDIGRMPAPTRSSPLTCPQPTAGAAHGSFTAMIANDDFRLFTENLPALCWMANADGYIFWYNRTLMPMCLAIAAEVNVSSHQVPWFGWRSPRGLRLLFQAAECATGGSYHADRARPRPGSAPATARSSCVFFFFIFIFFYFLLLIITILCPSDNAFRALRSVTMALSAWRSVSVRSMVVALRIRQTRTARYP